MSDYTGRDQQLLRWVEASPPAFEVVRENRLLRLDESTWQSAPRRLERGAGASYSQLARSAEFGPWWQSAVGGRQPGIRRFSLQLPADVWPRPWEAIIGALDPPRWDQVSIIRQVVGDAAGAQPSKLDEPLTVLRVEGAPTLGSDTLDLAAESESLRRAYEQLDFHETQAIAPPVAVKGRFDNLCLALVEHRPTILWFSGHARAEPPGILLDDEHWLDPGEFVEILRQAKERGGRTPLYAVLWACRTGSAPQFGEPTPAPAFVDALSAQGVAALLVSQAPLGDDIAERVAGSLLRALASGLPLDYGLVHARADLMRSALDNQTLFDTIDWICPVIWSKGHPPLALHWTDRREQSATRQALARKLLPARLSGVTEPAASVEPWPDQSRVWVTSAAPDATASQTSWWPSDCLV